MPGGDDEEEEVMATKDDFTAEEWEALEHGIMGAGTMVSLSDPKLFDTFKEAKAVAKHLRAAHEKSDSPLVRELATVHGNPFGMTASPEEVKTKTVDALQAAVTALQAKSPDDVAAYKALVLDVSESVADAAHGVSQSETETLEIIKNALGAT
jgi:hypothetical protein